MNLGYRNINTPSYQKPEQAVLGTGSNASEIAQLTESFADKARKRNVRREQVGMLDSQIIDTDITPEEYNIALRSATSMKEKFPAFYGNMDVNKLADQLANKARDQRVQAEEKALTKERGYATLDIEDYVKPAKTASSGRGSVYAQKMEAMKELAPEIEDLQSIVDTAGKLVIEDKNVDLTDLKVQYANKLTEIKSRSLVDLGFKTAEEVFKDFERQKFQQGKDEFAYKVDEDAEDGLLEAAKPIAKRMDATWGNKGVMLRLLRGWINQAKQGNPLAAKNLVAATSRLASNEALSDSELSIMLSGNISDLIQKWFNQLFGSGATIGKQDVINAINAINDFASNALDGANTELVNSVSRLKQQMIRQGEPAGLIDDGHIKSVIVNNMNSPLPPAKWETISTADVQDLQQGEDTSLEYVDVEPKQTTPKQTAPKQVTPKQAPKKGGAMTGF